MAETTNYWPQNEQGKMKQEQTDESMSSGEFKEPVSKVKEEVKTEEFFEDSEGPEIQAPGCEVKLEPSDKTCGEFKKENQFPVTSENKKIKLEDIKIKMESMEIGWNEDQTMKGKSRTEREHILDKEIENLKEIYDKAHCTSSESHSSVSNVSQNRKKIDSFASPREEANELKCGCPEYHSYMNKRVCLLELNVLHHKCLTAASLLPEGADKDDFDNDTIHTFLMEKLQQKQKSLKKSTAKHDEGPHGYSCFTCGKESKEIFKDHFLNHKKHPAFAITYETAIQRANKEHANKMLSSV